MKTKPKPIARNETLRIDSCGNLPAESDSVESPLNMWMNVAKMSENRFSTSSTPIMIVIYGCTVCDGGKKTIRGRLDSHGVLQEQELRSGIRSCGCKWP